jgi:hypothetical protein
MRQFVRSILATYKNRQEGLALEYLPIRYERHGLVEEAVYLGSFPRLVAMVKLYRPESIIIIHRVSHYVPRRLHNVVNPPPSAFNNLGS